MRPGTEPKIKFYFGGRRRWLRSPISTRRWLNSTPKIRRHKKDLAAGVAPAFRGGSVRYLGTIPFGVFFWGVGALHGPEKGWFRGHEIAFYHILEVLFL